MRFFFYQTLSLFLALLGLAVPLRAATEIPFSLQNGLIWVEVSIPGRVAKLHFVLDSGAGASVVNAEVAQSLALRAGAAKAVLGVQGGVAAHWVEDFSGSLETTPLPTRLLALDLSHVSATCHQRIDGLLGVDFFKERIVQIDFAARKLRLLRKGELPPNAGAGGETLPLVARGDSLCTKGAVGDSSAGWLRVDTGCDSELRWVAKAGQEASLRRQATVGLTAPAAHYLVADLQLGNLHLRGIKTGLHQKQIFPGEAGLLGNGLLSRFLVTFDAPGHRLILQPARS